MGLIISENRKYKASMLFIALFYGLGLSILPVDAFVDRDNYLIYAGSSLQIFSRYLDYDYWAVLFNEPIWLATNMFLGILLSPEDVLRVIIFFSASVTAYFVLRHEAKYFIFLMLILFLPQVLKNNIIHLRQGLAIAVFLCGWFSTRQNVRYAFFTFACLIHSSFFIIVFLIAINHFLIRFRLGVEIRAIVVFIGGIFVGVFGLWLAGLLGARQADQYIGSLASVSGLAFVFWAVIAALFVFQGRRFLRHNSLQFSIMIFYLSTYFLLPVTGRVFESGIILIFLSSLGLTSYRKNIFILAVSFYFFLQWFFRFSLPGFGWGIENYI